MLVRDNIQKQGYRLGDEGQKVSVSAKKHRRPVRRNVLIVTTGLMLLCAVVLAMYRMRKTGARLMGLDSDDRSRQASIRPFVCGDPAHLCLRYRSRVVPCAEM